MTPEYLPLERLEAEIANVASRLKEAEYQWREMHNLLKDVLRTAQETQDMLYLERRERQPRSRVSTWFAWRWAT